MNLIQSALVARVLAVLKAAAMVGAIMYVALYVLQIRTDGHLPLFYAVYLAAGFMYGVFDSERDYRTRYLLKRKDFMPLVPKHYYSEIVRWTFMWLPAVVLFILFKALFRLIGPPIRRRT